MSLPLLQIQPFKIYDKVRILKRDEDVWKTGWFGVIVKLGTTHALVFDHKKTDSNVGSINESSEWVPYESKCLKIIND